MLNKFGALGLALVVSGCGPGQASSSVSSTSGGGAALAASAAPDFPAVREESEGAGGAPLTDRELNLLLDALEREIDRQQGNQ